MNVLDLVRQLLACDDLAATVTLGEGAGIVDRLTETVNGFVILDPMPPLMAETLAAHQPVTEEPLPPLPQRAMPGNVREPLPPRDQPMRTTVAAVHVTGAADQAQADAEAALARWAHKTATEPRDDDDEQVGP